MEKIGIFGGTFDPVHNEHIRMAERVKEELCLSRVVAVPTFSPPHKTHSECAPAAARLEMLELAFGGKNVCDYEIREGGTSYTYKTLEHFKAVYPESELVFLVGGDMLEDFKTWRFPERILAAAKLAAFEREGAYVDFDRECGAIKTRFGADVIRLSYRGKRVSSTKIRLYAMFGLDISPYVPSAVARYIAGNGLYPPTPAVRLVRTVLGEKRFAHTANVAACALDKAKSLGLDRDKVFDACVYHDIAKYADKAKFPAAVPADAPAPVAHAFLGAYMLEHVYGVKDRDVINAVRYHTTGRAGMSDLEKLVFVADMVEEGRTFDGAERLRRLFDADFDACFSACVETTRRHLLEAGKTPYRLTEECYDYYVKEKRI